jgi:O-antigen/teichoic acid export membrane protein
MNQVQKIAKNSIVLTMANVAGLLLFLAMSIFIARNLGALEFGKWSFAHSFAYMFAIITQLGLDMLIIRDIAADKEKIKDYFYNGLAIKTLLAVFVFALIVITINLLNYPSDTRLVVYIIGAAIIFDSFSRYFYSIFRAFERMEFEAFLFVLTALIISVFGLILLFLGYSIIQIALVVLIAHIINFLLGFYIVKKKFLINHFQFSYKVSKNIIKKALPFFGIVILVRYSIDINGVMLSIINGNEAVGYFSAAHKLIISLGVLLLFIDSVFPVMAKFYKTSKQALSLTYKKAFKYVYTFVLPISIGTYMLADKIIFLIYGDQYINSVIILKILAFYLLFFSLIGIFITLLMSIHRTSTLLKINVFSVILLTASNYIFISNWGYNGLAMSNLMVVFITFIVYFVHISNKFYKLSFSIFYKPLLSALMMGAIIYILESSNLFLIIFVSMIVYFGGLLLTKTFSEEDYRLIRKCFSLKLS